MNKKRKNIYDSKLKNKRTKRLKMDGRMHEKTSKKKTYM